MLRADTEYDPPRATIRVRFRNRARATYRRPDPIEPTTTVIRWRSLESGATTEERRRVLLPIAVAPAAVAVREIDLETPAPTGRWRVTVTTDDGAPRVLAAVDVVAATAERHHG
jgi:hypothetical protein